MQALERMTTGNNVIPKECVRLHTQSTQPGGDGHPQLSVYLLIHAPPHTRERVVRYHESGHRAHARAHVLAIRGAYQPYTSVSFRTEHPPHELGLQTSATLSGCLPPSRRPKTLRCRFGRSSPPSLGLQTGVTCPASSDRHGARSSKAPH